MIEQGSAIASFPIGGGEMGQLIREKDWSKTSLGDSSFWQQSLKTTLNILLYSKFPKFLWWGPELLCFYNDAYRPSLGRDGKHPSILGMPGEEAWPEIWETIKPLMDQVLEGGESLYFENLLVPIHRNGHMEDAYWTFSYSPAWDDSGIICGVIVTCAETTQEVFLKRKLESSERKLRLIIQQAPASIATFMGPEYHTDIANTNALNMWGRKAEEVMNKPILEILPELEKQGIKGLLDEVYKTGNRFAASELPVKLLRDGELKTSYISFSYEALYDESGEINGIISIGHDVTEQVIAHKKIEASEEKLTMVIDASELGTFDFNVKNKILDGSDRLHEIFGLAPGSNIHHEDFVSNIHPKDLKVRQAAFERAFISGNLEYTSRVITNGNQIKWIEVKGRVHFDKKNNPEKVIGTVRDITAEKLNIQKLEESEQKFRLLANSLPQHIWTADNEGNINYFNKSVYDFSGYSPERLEEEGWIAIVHPDDRAGNIKAWSDSISTGKDFLFEHRFRKYDGTYRWQLSRAKPQLNEDGEIQMWVGSSTDIHDQKEFMNELEKLVVERTDELAKKVKDLASMNKELQSFAYISSHDLQEPLRKIQTFSTLLLEQEYENLTEQGKEFFKRMQSAAQRMQNLISDLLAYSRTSISERKYEPTDLNKLIVEVKMDLKEELAAHNATVESDELCTLDIIPFQFRQLLQNLISNSLKFAVKNRAPIISIKSEKRKGREIEAEFLSPDINYCHIRISDNGIGFEDQYKERIFELFQRLNGKDKYQGTGIGLAIVKKIVENHNGYIAAHGKPDQGATFDIYLPES
ncbi:PAS domain S-box protein [Algoriphagus winogradskyi]|uniref:histidine kinase n=1 Tax=Algoriphagus winogradskyi TaxID=237017 RepID=A0ABY1PC50_9BACT|nr:PAS domain S-box protein [Algoriphagus winogradskyi]SMP31188.1 PAS/PAC sensor hybrid histidine kinase [Algoriphagus winogradskyi]